jgi:hypothetical protein
VCVNGPSCDSQILTVTEFLNLFPDDTETAVCSGIMLKNNDNVVE